MRIDEIAKTYGLIAVHSKKFAAWGVWGGLPFSLIGVIHDEELACAAHPDAYATSRIIAFCGGEMSALYAMLDEAR